jgi:hypothetical protein
MEHKFLVDPDNLLLFEYYQDYDTVMSFKVYEIAIESNGNVLHLKDLEIVPMEEADVFIEGHIKWDGCVNFTHPSEKNCMSHECGNPAKKYGIIWNTLYKLAAGIMPKHKEYLT